MKLSSSVVITLDHRLAFDVQLDIAVWFDSKLYPRGFLLRLLWYFRSSRSSDPTRTLTMAGIQGVLAAPQDMDHEYEFFLLSAQTAEYR